MGQGGPVHHQPGLFEGLPEAYAPWVRLAVLRLILRFGVHKCFLTRFGIFDGEFLPALGFESLLNQEGGPSLVSRVLGLLWRELQAMELTPPRLPRGTPLARNLSALSRQVALSPLEAGILHVLVLQQKGVLLGKALEMVEQKTSPRAVELLAALLDEPVSAVFLALQPEATLMGSGLLGPAPSGSWMPWSLLHGLGEALCLGGTGAGSWFRQGFSLAPPPTLDASAFGHLEQDLKGLEAYLRWALRDGRRGANILLHGRPGTGKTELARLLARLLKRPLFEVASVGRDGGPLPGDTRVRAYRLAQAVLSRGRSGLILFDEAEGLFTGEGVSPGPGEPRIPGHALKAWINRSLEDNPVPALWITNHSQGLDPAYLRRFDCILELKTPPRSVRLRILEDRLEGLAVGDEALQALAQREDLVPALVDRAAQVVRGMVRSNPKLPVEASLTRWLGHALDASGSPLLPGTVREPGLSFRLEVLNADCDLGRLVRGLKAQGVGRLCLFGPPGTGKTAFTHHLARLLDLPLISKRVSDLQSMWVGETERNIARMFESARQEGAVLLLDEADSFLQDRARAGHSWEITQVNEMLTQMEGFQGIFVAATNLAPQLDPAASRRFDLKIQFRHLGAEQAWTLFQDAAGFLGMPVDPGLRTMLDRLTTLTPGDFSVVVRQRGLRPIVDALDLVRRLREEVEARPGSGHRIGF